MSEILGDAKAQVIADIESIAFEHENNSSFYPALSHLKKNIYSIKAEETKSKCISLWYFGGMRLADMEPILG